ncbi:MAG: hypothetical protein ACR2F2_01325, partial [Pyrinomonadaceae bacterium]
RIFSNRKDRVRRVGQSERFENQKRKTGNLMRSEIKTENLILRKYEISFIPLLFEAAVESRGGEFPHWMP